MSEGAPRDSEEERECSEDPEVEFVDSVRSVSLRLMADIVFEWIFRQKTGSCSEWL